jgi:glycosyltransferase involved in cell wall biosynthesis
MADLAVIMSVYLNDKLNFVQESVQSILGQSFTDFHFYIVFDGPVTSDVDIYVSSISDERIRLYRLEKNGGLAKALNYLLIILLNNPEYKFIARMDADDVSMYNRFDKQCEFLFKHPDISCVGSWYQEIDELGTHISFRRLPSNHKEIRALFINRCPLAHSSVMFTRMFIETVGFYTYDTYHMEDYVLWGTALKSGMVLANIPEYLLKFRIDKNFYKRRSGLKYGWNFIKTRFAIHHNLGLPVYSYFMSAGIGILRMSPSFMLKMFYKFILK